MGPYQNDIYYDDILMTAVVNVLMENEMCQDKTD